MKEILTISLLAILFVGCSDDDTKSSSTIEGCYLEHEEPDVLQFAGSNHRICFEGDSILRLEITSWGDLIIQGLDSCNMLGTEIYEGVYYCENDTLRLTGMRTDKLINNESIDCEPLPIIQAFPYEEISDSIILLNPSSTTLSQIRLIKE